MNSPHIAILATGSQGAAVGADFALAGCNVTFVEQWPAHVDAMRTEGIRLNPPAARASAEPENFRLTTPGAGAKAPPGSPTQKTPRLIEFSG